MNALPLLAFLSLGVAAATAAPLPRSSPEAQGISSAAVRAFVDAADRQIDSMHSVMIVRHGHVVAEGWWGPYRAESPHTFYSLTKSFTSTAVGLAIAEGKLTLDDPIISFFPEFVPENASAQLKGMRVRDLLAMSTGHHADVLGSFFQPPGSELARAFLALPVAHKPGTHFVYNTPASHMLAEILQKITGEKVVDYLRPRLLDPLGIEGIHWAETADGVSLGGYGMAGRTEDIARFGQLYLQRGMWNGTSLLPSSWVEAASARQTSNGSDPNSEWDQGYGYQFWRCRHDAYRGDGAFGQYCMILPEQDVVIAMTSGVRDMQAVMNLVWEKLLPEMKPSPLRESVTDLAALRERMSALQLATPAGAATPSGSQDMLGARYRLAENAAGWQAITLQPGADGTELVVERADRRHVVTIGSGDWRHSRTGLYPELSHDPVRSGEQPVAAAGAWRDANTFVAKLWLTETPFAVTLTLRFNGTEVTIDAEQNVSFGARQRPALSGTRSASTGL